MARRATFIKELRANPDTAGKTLVLSGAGEFWPDGPEKPPTDQALAALVKAFGLLAPEAGCLTPSEAKVLADKGLAPPPGFEVLDAAPKTRRLNVGGLRVGLVFFPVLKNGAKNAPPEAMEAAAAAARGLRADSDLVIGLSPWGGIDEEAFLSRPDHGLDVLLGSGPGPGQYMRTASAGRTLWSRSYTQGKALIRLDILGLPNGPGFVWKLGESVTAQAVPLDQGIADDPAYKDLM